MALNSTFNTAQKPLPGALIKAATDGDTAAVRILLERGADPDGENEEGNTALAAAAMRGYTSIARLLIDNHANTNKPGIGGNTALIEATRFGYQSIISLLLDNDANIDATGQNGETALMGAVRGGKKDIAALLIDRGADITLKNPFNMTISNMAVGRADIVKMIEDITESRRLLAAQKVAEKAERIRHAASTAKQQRLRESAKSKPRLL